MADEKDKAIEKKHPTQPNVPEVEDELSDIDFEKVVGGSLCDCSNQSQLGTTHTYLAQ